MHNAIIIPKEELDQLKEKISHLEKMMGQLLEKVEQTDIFDTLVNSQAFEEHKTATIARYTKDPSRFVDPFETFQSHA